MTLVNRIHRVADKALSKLVGESTAKAACAPYWHYYCSYNPAICSGGHVRYRKYIMGTCDTCCVEYVGCC
ncbi:hypothetical protein LX16_4239 [Stackebrandtia albiflava]|uniref:Uncharacterized protein n=1 Tax=Stackebrandtia albiflava TaxID=406432 RepID=A0A562UYY1_9ACTN|nr:hypothetical protein [Stackebrandtia albiflava]TWJ10815.1 hypothetical protein LX16_4239 [Stackebrandtia albiflava]